MNCTFVIKHITDVVERDLPPSMLQEVDEHLRSCDRCARMVEQYSRIWNAEDRIEFSPTFWLRLQHRIQKSDAKRLGLLRPFPAWNRWLRPVVAAATLCVGIVVGYNLGNVPAQSAAAEQFFQYHIENLDDFPAGSVGEFYAGLDGNNDGS